MQTVKREQGFVAVVVAVVLGLLFVVSTVLWISTASSKSDLDSNFDEKVATEVAVAVQEAESAKEVEFLEKEKSPVRTYTGSATYGSLTFDYPKTWSVYSEENSSGAVLDIYAHPSVVPGTGSEQVYALRIEITSTPYDKEVERFSRDIESGEVSSTAFRPENVNAVLGVLLNGEIDRGVQGSMVLLPLRDRTIKVFTESQEFAKDFNSIVLPSLTFVP